MSKMFKTKKAYLYLGVIVLLWTAAASQSLAEGTVRGEARMEIIKGQPQMGYKDLFEWNLFLSPTSSPPVGPHRRIGGDTGNGDFAIEDMPAGVYSIFVNQPIFFARPVVAPNVFISDGEMTVVDVDVPIDFSTYVFDNWTGPSNEWFQTYTATGTSVTGVGFVVAGTSATTIEVALLENNGEPDVRDWLEVGSRLRRQVKPGGDQWVRWRSGEIPTIPGRQYAVRLRSTDGANFQPMMRGKDANSYVGGRAYNRDGTPQFFDLNVTVFVDNDGTVITMSKRECCLGNLQSQNYGQRWAQTFTAQGTSLAGVDLWAAGANGIWDLDFEWKVHEGGPDGAIIGPTKITKAGFQASGVGLHGASFNPGDVPLIPGQTYSVEVVISNPPPKSNGFNPMVMDNDSYDGGIAHQYVGTTWFARPDTDLSMTLLEYVDTPEIGLSTASLATSTEKGTSPASDTFTVQNVGDATLHYTITDSATWLDVTPASGSSTGEMDTITVHYSTESLPAGVYTATITISDPLATNDPQTIDVNLTVNGSGGCVTLALQNGRFENGCDGWTGYCSDSSTIWNPGPNEGSGWGSVQSGGALEPWFSWQTVPADSIPTTLAGFMADGSHENHDHVVQLIDGDENGTVMDEFRRNSVSGSSHGWTDLGILTGTPKSGRVTVKFGWIPNSRDWSAGTATHVDALELLQCSPALPRIGLAPRTLNREAEEGKSPAPDTFTVTNSGEGTLNYEVRADVDWLSVTPTSGTSAGEQDTITVQYSTARLARGIHHGTITVSDPNAGNSPQTLTVMVTITEPLPCINGNVVNADFEGGLSNWLVFGRTDGALDSPFHNVYAENGARMFGAAAGWETKNGGAYQRVSVCEGAQVDASASIYTAQVGGGDWDVSCRIGIDPTGGTDPGSTDILWTEWADSAGGWSRIGLTGDEAVIAEGDAVTLFIEHRHKWALRFNLTLFDNIFFDATSVGEAPAIDLSPTSFVHEIEEGGHLEPDTFVVTNVGGGTLDYTAGVDADWMSVSPSQGSSTGEQDTITLSYSTAHLAPGTYEGKVTVSDPNAGNDPQTVRVTMKILPAVGCTNGSLVNGGFEGALSSWVTFGTTDGRMPYIHGVNPHGGSWMFGGDANWGTANGGAYQHVQVCPGAVVEASVWILTRQIGAQNYDVNGRIGIDPTGGTDPGSRDIVWSSWYNSPEAWSPIGLTGLEAAGDTITVFIEHWHRWPVQFNFTAFDDVVVTATGGSGQP
jgi:hypothetical protein